MAGRDSRSRLSVLIEEASEERLEFLTAYRSRTDPHHLVAGGRPTIPGTVHRNEHVTAVLGRELAPV